MNLVLVSSALVISFVLVLITIPPILRIARAKLLFEPFEERKIHSTTIPPLGGVAIFIGFTLSSIIATDGLSFDSLKYIIASVIAMFFIGLKDDLLAISAHKKLGVQVFASVILITLGNVRFTNLHGILGVHEIGFFPSVIISIFIMVAIINAFNLIDGIDGLASGITMVGATSFGLWFYLSGNTQFSIMSFALVGSIAGFFIFNVFGKRNKLFMGDTGSLIIGIVISTLVIKFNEFNISYVGPFAVHAAPSVSLAIIIVPLIDTLRVMTIRISNGISPFTADNNHIHHQFLKLTPIHLKITMSIIVANIAIVGIALFLNKLELNVNIQFVLILLFGIAFSLIPSMIVKSKTNKRAASTKTSPQFS
jgi:UDP-N-acetylmuramyl pentapeptide phosphotransferase/UDP-N-acetylglucosamine-1-phosphate transferase